jgi:uncharacterized protein
MSDRNENAPASVRLEWGIKIPMRDGTRLNATVYLPREVQIPAPAILAMTPYVADHLHDRAAYFAAHGFPFVAVDVRGRGNSEGTFRPRIQEARDGFDAVEWLARQPYCNGKVAMWGGSYLGYCQWAAAKEFPPHLQTIVPTAAPCIGVDLPMRNNIFYPYVLQWLVYTSGKTSQVRTFCDSAFWSTLFRRWYQSGRSFRALGEELGNPSPIFQDYLDHPEPDAYWDAYNPTADEYSRIDIPILTLTGCYDGDQPGALEHYRRHLRHASSSARHFLVIGPWDHAGLARPALEFDGLRVGPASLLDLARLHVEWYAWTMQSGERPGFLQAPVSYYVMGSERWRYAQSLEAVTARHEALFLDSSGHANDVFASGSLGAAVGVGPPDSYRYDPRQTDGPEVQAELRADVGSLVDQSVVLALGGRQLVYHSAPFEQDREVSGFFRLETWLSIDCRDTDVYVSVYEIDAHGGSVQLSTDAMRARYREGLRTPRLIQTDAPLLYHFERFTFISRLIRRGHRLRLVIAPFGQLIGGIFTQRNFNGGGAVADESVSDAQPVTVCLFHDDRHRSILYMPLGQL